MKIITISIFVGVFVGLSSYATESKVICATAGQIGEANVFSINHVTQLAITSLNEKISYHQKSSGHPISISAPTLSVVPINNETLKEVTVVACVTIRSATKAPDQPLQAPLSNQLNGMSFGPPPGRPFW